MRSCIIDGMNTSGLNTWNPRKPPSMTRLEIQLSLLSVGFLSAHDSSQKPPRVLITGIRLRWFYLVFQPGFRGLWPFVSLTKPGQTQQLSVRHEQSWRQNRRLRLVYANRQCFKSYDTASWFMTIKEHCLKSAKYHEVFISSHRY